MFRRIKLIITVDELNKMPNQKTKFGRFSRLPHLASGFLVWVWLGHQSERLTNGLFYDYFSKTSDKLSSY